MKPSQIDDLFQIVYKRLVMLLLPTFLRYPRIFAFLQAMTFSVGEVHWAFRSQRDKNIRRIRYNGQVCHLQGLLNDELDNGKRRIKIEEGDTNGDWLFAWDEETGTQPLMCSEPASSEENPAVTLVYSEALIIRNTAAFVVKVPFSDTNQINRLKSFLNEYKLLSKKYTIK